MKQKLNLLLLLICIMCVWQVKAQVPPTEFTNISSGTQTINNDTLTNANEWYHWVADTGVVHANIKLKQQGYTQQLTSAELYTVNNGILVLTFRDTLVEPGDSSLNLYAGYVSSNTDIYIRLKNAANTCTTCIVSNPIITLLIENSMTGCGPSVPCDMVKNGNFESTVWPGCGISAEDGIDCWVTYQNTSDAMRRYCTATSWVNLGYSTLNTSPPLNSRNGAPNNAILGQFCMKWPNEYTESVQTLLSTPLVTGRSYSLSCWAYNYQGQILTSNYSNAGGMPTWITFATSAGYLPASYAPSPSTYPAGISTITNFSVSAINTWTQLTYTFTYSGSTNYNLLLGPNLSMDVSYGWINTSGNKVHYIALDEVSLIDITPVTITSQNNHVNCQYNIATYTLTAHNVATYTWQPGGLVGQTVVVSPSVTTVYTVTGATACGLTSNSTYTVVVNPTPQGTISATSSTICPGANTTLTVTGSNFSPTHNIWSPSPCVPSSCVNSSVTVSPTTTTTYTVKLSSASGCTNTAQATITVLNPTNSINILGTTTVCPGQSTTLTASGGSSYSWNPCSSSCNSNSIVVTPTSSTIYTLTGINQCGTASTSNIAITVNPPAPVTVNSATICAGNSATLTAGSANSYTWSTGATTPSIVVTPTANTNYTVTGYNGICFGSAVSSVTVVANYLPGSYNITSPSLPVIANGTGTNSINLSTTITNTTGLTFNWQPGSITTPTANYNITQTQIISLTVTSPFCSSSTQSICVNYVAAICSNTFTELASTLTNTTITNQTFKVAPNTTVTINGQVSVTSSTFLMGTNSAIVINPGSRLVFYDAKVYSCDGMWYGIKTLFNSSTVGTVEVRNTTIEDAYKAIDADNALNTLFPSVYANGGSIFNKNYIDISMDNTLSHLGSNSLFYIENTTMSSQSSTTSPGSNLKCSGYYTPTIKARSYAGVYAVNAGVISFTSNPVYGNNTIKNKDFGLFFKKTDAEVYNANFMDMIGYQDPSCLPSCATTIQSGIGIFSSNAPKFLNVKPLSGSTTVNTYFSNVGYGILTSKTPSVDIQYCSFDNPSQFYNTGPSGEVSSMGNIAIYTLDNAGMVRINKNTINRTLTGVTINYSVATTTAGFLLSVGQNTITAGTGTLATGVNITSALTTPFNGTITSEVVAANNITNASSVGVRLQNVTGGLRVSGNSITLTSANGTKDGIFLNGGNSNVLVDNNTIDGNLTGTITAFNPNCSGIRSINSAGCKLQCNYITKVGKGVEYNGGNSSPGAGFFKNTLQFPIRRGLVLSNGGLIGMQGSSTGSVVGASANVWAGAWPTPASTVEPQQTLVGGPLPTSIASDAANSPLWVRSTEAPFDNYFASPSIPAYVYNFSPTTFTTTINDYATCPTSLTTGAKLSSSSATVASNEDRDADYLKYMNTLLPAASTSLSPQDKYMLKQVMFEDLAENPSTNTTLQNFYNQQVNTSVGAYNTIDELLAAGNITLANTKNTQAPVTNDITQTQNSFNALYINGITTQTDFDNLKQLANLCPNQYGNAVFQARALLQILTYQYVEYSDSCYMDKLNARFGYDDDENSVSVNDNVQAKLYPNPNNGSFTIAYDLKKNNEAFMVIVDVTGKEVYQSSIDNLEYIKQINTSNLQSGIYFVQLRNQKTLLWTDKLMITK